MHAVGPGVREIRISVLVNGESFTWPGLKMLCMSCMLFKRNPERRDAKTSRLLGGATVRLEIER